jgi:GR25 family glycosyltransferase involved in LPS biosynthesis
MLNTIPCLIIHRDEDTDREPTIEALEQALGHTIQRFDAISGDFLLEQGFPSQHPRESTPTSAGNIGCTASHIEILEATLRSEFQQVCIFEDDAELVGELELYLDAVKNLPEADLVFLGVNEIVDGEPVAERIFKIRRFWGTHAVLVNRRACEAIFEVYRQSLSDGYALPADWLYSHAIQTKGLVAYAPVRPVIRQKPGLVSLTSGNVRTA